MATEITARAERPAPDAPDDGDYETFCAALSASARGRAFLSEYTGETAMPTPSSCSRQSKHLQQAVSANNAPPVTDTIKAELRMLLDEVTSAQIELEASIVATKATKLAAWSR